jgi:hypothetical protein
MVIASCVLNSQRQLASGKRSRAENSGGNRCKNNVLDFPIHGSSSLFQQTGNRKKMDRSRLLSRRLNSRGMCGAEAGGGFQREGADAAGLAWVTRAAASAAGDGLSISVQLARGKRSRAENSHNKG